MLEDYAEIALFRLLLLDLSSEADDMKRRVKSSPAKASVAPLSDEM